MAFISKMVFGEDQLTYLLPGVQEAERKLRSDANALGITYKIADFGGARTVDIVSKLIRWRDEAVANGEPYYRVSPYSKTKHALGAAFDIRVTGRPDGMTLAAAYAKLGALARPHGLIWGGTFSAPADIYHFESQQTLAQLDPRWEAWKKDPQFPRMGAADWTVLVVLAILFIAFLLVR